MSTITPDRVSDENIKAFLEKTPGIDLGGFDFHAPDARQKLVAMQSTAAPQRAPRGKLRAAAVTAAPEAKTAGEAPVAPETLETLLAFQRCYRLTRDVAQAEGLMALGLDSAAKIASLSPARFVEATSSVFGDDVATAQEVYARAGHVKTAALQLYGSVKDLTASPYYGKARFNSASSDVVDYFTNLPSYSALFGNMNYLETDPGQTIFSPSAYFFDAMRIVDEYITYPNTSPVRTIPKGYTLEERRPDLFALKLTPDNSFTEIPTLDLVNEILAYSIHARDGQDAYQYLAAAPYPFNLPYVRPLQSLRQALTIMQTPLATLYTAMSAPEAGTARVQPLDAARESLGLSVTDLARLETPDPSVTAVTRAYGYDIPRVPPPFSGLGVVGTLVGSSDVAGCGSRFTAEFKPGDSIQIGGAPRKVTTIASDTALTVEAPWTQLTAMPYIVAPNAPPPSPPFTGQGTVAISPDNAQVTGSGTAFSTQINVGDTITAAQQTRKVVAIASDTVLTVDSAYPYISQDLAYTVTPQAAKPPTPFVGAGGVVFVGQSVTTTGIGTRFLTDYAHGGTIKVDQTTLTVDAVTSDTALSVTTAWPATGGQNYLVQPAERTGDVLDVLPVTGPGTVSWSTTSTTLTGKGTEFLKDLRISDQITVGVETRTVVAILSATEAVLELAPQSNAVDQAYLILKMDGLDLVTIFLERTGLSTEALTALLTQNLSPAELAAGGADGFFINATGESPAAITTYFCSDPNNPTQRLAGLTLKRLDRLSRFIRLANSCGWSFADLQWAMTATGAQEITTAFVLDLGRMTAVMASEDLTATQTAALFHNLKTSGKIDDRAPQDPFDLIYNTPAMLQGQDPYRPGSTTPFDPYRTPVQVWTIANMAGDDGIIRGRLKAALRLNDGDLSRLALYVRSLVGASDPAKLPLDLTNLSWLARLASCAQGLAWSVDAYLTFLGLLYYPTAQDYFLPPKGAVTFALDTLQAQFSLAHWLDDSGFTTAQLQYVTTGASPSFPPPYPVAELADFQAQTAVAAAPLRLSSAGLASLQLNAAEASALFDHLVGQAFVTDLGVSLRDHAAYGDIANFLPVRATDTPVFGFDADSFVLATPTITPAQSSAVYQALLTSAPPILTPVTGANAAVAETFTATTDLSFLTPIFPQDSTSSIEAVRLILLTARAGIDGLAKIIAQTSDQQTQSLIDALADFLSLSKTTLGALFPMAGRLAPLPQVLSAFLTPLPAGTAPPAGLANFVAWLARIGVASDTCALDGVETAYATSQDGAVHFGIADWAHPTLQNIASLSDYVALRNAVGARQDQLIAYFQTPSSDPDTKAQALATATAWPLTDIVALETYFWPTPTPSGADTVAGLTRMAGVFALQRRLGLRTPMLEVLVSTSHMALESAPGVIDPTAWATYEQVAQAALAALNASFTGSALDDANKALTGAVNTGSRDALVGNVLWWMNARNPTLRAVNDLYKFLLLDVEMGACATTSKVAQAIASTQLYMQRCRMMLEPGVLRVDIPTIWWSWIMNYRVWEANRRIFVYPENYIEPSLRQGATPQFAELADSLLQNDPTKTNVVPPFESFIKELAVLGNLSPVGASEAHTKDQRSGEEKETLFLIGRTRTQPYQFYFRALDDGSEWNPWIAIDLTINGDRISPVYAFGRLFVFWIEFDTAKSNTIANQASSTETVDKAKIKYAFYNNGIWSSVQTLDDAALINTYPSSYSTISQPGPVADKLRKENSYWQFPYVVSTGEGLVGAGRIAFTPGLGTVDGERTQFTREVRAGDRIVCMGQTRTVGAVASDTSLVVTEPWTSPASDAEYKITALSQGGRYRPFVGTGTVSTTTGMPLVTGANTRFLDEFVYGDTISIDGEAHLVILIQDQQTLLVDQNWIGSYTNAAFTVMPGAQGKENILICYSASAPTQAPLAFAPKSTTDNPTKNSFIGAQNALNTSVYDGLWLASQYQPNQQNIPGVVPIADCSFLDADLTRSQAKVLLTDYAYAASGNPRPYRPDLIRQYARLSVRPSDNLIVDNYWGANLPGQFDSNTAIPTNTVDLLFNVAKTTAALTPVGNKPGSFVFDNVDEAFLVRPTDPSINYISEAILRSQRPWRPDLLNSQVIATGAYSGAPKPLTATNFSFVRLNTIVMPTLQARLFAGGIDRLLTLSSQYLPELPFNRFYPPPGVDPPPHVIPVGSNLMDFDGAYGLYFWEIFFHAPFLVADRLQGAGRFEEALNWLQYIFNPTQAPDETDPQDTDPAKRYWRFRPFRDMDQPSLRKVLSDPLQIRRYNYDPFDPDAIAAIRPVAYAKAIVMRYVDVLLDWADALFTQYTRESITQATNLYVLAEDLLGERPKSLGRLPLPAPKSFNELKAEYPAQQIPQFLIDLENTPFVDADNDNARYPSQPVNDIVAYFAAPENADFMKYWERVEDRLFKIRHCMNIDGQVTPLALYAPPIDPALLIQAMASGGIGALSQALAETVPYYRFAYLIDRAEAMVQQLAGLNSALLSALEKRDAEALSQLTNQQEALLLKLTTVIKEQEIADVEANGEALNQSLASAQYRQQHYAALTAGGLSAREQSSLDAMLAALVFNTLGTVTKTAASIGYAVPQVGSPFAMTYGGQQIGNALNAASGVFEIGAAISTFVSQQTQTLAAYDRRAEDWALQDTLAGYDVAQLTDQIRSNGIRLAIAKQNLVIHEETIKQNRDRAKFLKDKFTNAALYQWMSNQIARTQFQTYTLAYQLCLTVQRAFQFENGTGRSFLNFNYWDAAHRGVTSADGLTLALSQMRAAALDVSRPLEIERTIALSEIDPLALIRLRETGECLFSFTEKLFDYDYPGHYSRVIKTLSVSIPCVVGPYQNIKATLTQLGNQVVLTAGEAGLDAVAFLLGAAGAVAPPATALRSNWRNFQEITLSSGQDDSGLFALNLEDSRYLPFEGTGAVSSWRLSMPKGANRIAFDAIGDVIITVKYTARDGGEAFRRKVAGLDALKPFTAVDYVDCRSMYFDAWNLLFASAKAGSQTLSLAIPDFTPPNVDRSKLLGFYLTLEADASVPGDYVTVKFPGALNAGLTLSAVNDATWLFDQHQQTPPSVAKATSAPIDIVFDLSKTPVDLIDSATGQLSPDALKNIQVVFYYSGTVNI
ncbi:neuraminidase-like domain-containing protein [Caulobacter sp.]|uniref:Tc toxin subunit A-related protein n=1 Tax=Caulobacter sp. TaxID=78 RepID=UPI001B06E018|nr:neuraminidase-like domain-containing protein [Caulobacter sp.]MBO9545432.1 hypothetical protein [Caulobacter sp.]